MNLIRNVSLAILFFVLNTNFLNSMSFSEDQSARLVDECLDECLSLSSDESRSAATKDFMQMNLTGQLNRTKLFAEAYFALSENQKPSPEETTASFLNLRLEYPLHQAARYGLSSVVENLLREKFQVEETEENFEFNVNELDETVMRSKRTPIYIKNTPLHYAVLFGHVNTVRILLDFGANPNLVNRAHCSPLRAAIISQSTDGSRVEIIKMLLDKGALIQDNINDISLITLARLHKTITSDGKDDIVIRLLIDAEKGQMADNLTLKN